MRTDRETQGRQKDPGKTRGPGVVNSYAILGRQGPWGWGIPMQFWATMRS